MTPSPHQPVSFARALTIGSALLALLALPVATAPLRLAAQIQVPAPDSGQPVSPAPDDSPISAAPDIAPVAPVVPASSAFIAIAAQNDQNLRAEIELLKSRLTDASQKNDAATAELNTAIAALKTENADLRDNIQKREDERGALIQKLAAAQLALQKKEKADDTGAAVAAELTKARLNIDALNTQVQNLTDENQRLAAQIDEAKTRATQTSATASEKLDDAQKQLADAQKQLDTAQKQLAETRDAGAGLQTKLTETQTKAESLETSLADATAQLKTAAAERDKALAERDAAKSAAASDTDAALATMTKERDNLAQRVSGLEQQIAANSAVSADTADRLRKKLAAMGEVLSATKTSEESKQGELEKSRKTQAEAETRAAELTNQVTAATHQLADTKQQLADTASALAVTKDTQPLYEQIVAQLSMSRDTLRQAQAQAAQLADENTRLKERLAAAATTTTTAAIVSNTTATAAAAATNTTTAAAPAATTAAATTTAATGATGASTEQSQPQAQAQPQTHTVAAGENLSTISRKYYGSAAYWKDIYDANRDLLATPDALRPGMKLRIP